MKYFSGKDVRLSSVHPGHIEAFYQSLYERGLKSNSVLHYHALLHKALADAARKGLIAKNPMENVQRPSKGNFIYGRTSHKEALEKGLIKDGISIRYFNGDTFRITVGSHMENRKVVESIKNIFGY